MSEVHLARIRAAKFMAMVANLRTGLALATAKAATVAETVADFGRTLVKSVHQQRKEMLELKYGPAKDDEILAFRLAKKYAAAGRLDLVEETLDWLANRWVIIPEVA